MIHEPIISVAPAFDRRVAGAATVIACSKNPGWPISTVQPYLAISSWVQLDRSQRNHRTTLHQCSPMGQAISTFRSFRSSGSSKTGTTQGLWPRSRDLGNPNCYLPPTGFRVGLHYLVFGQVRGPSSSAHASQITQSGNHSSHPYPPWSTLFNRADMVREQRSEFRGKKNAIIELYRHPPKRGVVVCFDEFGPLQTIPRGGQAWGKKPARRPDRYCRNGTLQWFGAFCPTSGQSVGQGSSNKNADSCKRFWEGKMLPFWSKGSIHLIMDNLSAHKKALRILPYKLRRRIKVYWLPTNSSWLNLIESYFATLQTTGLDNTNYKNPEEIDRGLQKGVQYLNLNPKPYIWKKI
jgi:transposase